MSRHEAKAVPNLLVASSVPNAKPQEELYTDYPEGYYSDGAYTAFPLPSKPSAVRQAMDNTDQDPQDAYYASLCTRFTELQATMHSAPLTSEVDNTAVLLKLEKRAIWRGKILKTQPKMLTLSQLPHELVIYGLEILTELLTKRIMRDENQARNVGVWAWGLLGRCRRIGEMGSEEVAVLRDLGKQGVWLIRRLVAGEVAEEDSDGNDPRLNSKIEEEDDLARSVEGREENEGGAIGISNGAPASADLVEESVRVAQQRLLSSLEAEAPVVSPVVQEDIYSKQDNELRTQYNLYGANTKSKGSSGVTSQANILATLDMLVTVIGELYGQRDLLEGRLLWDELP